MEMEARKKALKISKRAVHLSSCSAPRCFFCVMKEQEPSTRRSAIAKFFEEMPQRDDQEHVLVLSGLWNIAMAQPNDPEFPTLGIFHAMAGFIRRGLTDPSWLLRHQNVYIPYYAAHVIGSYTMNVAEFAEKAVQSGVIPPLVELLRGRLSWVEQRVAVRALGHLASYDHTFDAVARHEKEVVETAMRVASTCLGVVYRDFLGAGAGDRRKRYQCDLLTRGMGGAAMEDRKAEEWASHLQCWSLYLLSCFASRERSLHLICREGFLKDLCRMWGGLSNDSSPAGVGLLRILCYSKHGRKCVADCTEVVESLCHLSRSSDDWQYIGIDCLLFLIKDPDNRLKVLETAAVYLADLVELSELGGRKRVGEAVAESLLLDYEENTNPSSSRRGKSANMAQDEVWELTVKRKSRERSMSREEVAEKTSLVQLKKKQGNDSFWSGDVEEAAAKYSEALAVCPLKARKERVILYSNRAQCRLVLRDPDGAISDATRALCLSRPANSHKKSLWRRSQAYDMKGLAKESLMDCLTFVSGGRCFALKRHRPKLPHYAARMISKQMSASWLFAGVHSRLKPPIGMDVSADHQKEEEDGGGDGVSRDQNDGEDEEGGSRDHQFDMIRERIEKVPIKNIPSLSTLLEERWPKEAQRVMKGAAGPRRMQAGNAVRSCLFCY